MSQKDLQLVVCLSQLHGENVRNVFSDRRRRNDKQTEFNHKNLFEFCRCTPYNSIEPRKVPDTLANKTPNTEKKTSPKGRPSALPSLPPLLASTPKHARRRAGLLVPPLLSPRSHEKMGPNPQAAKPHPVLSVLSHHGP
ncbi:hypothetical protein MPTK1_8g12500 [Marchantia polymorpha subsp. ruderalis]|uniref:Uncharacterized protein n=1 Tax=Marchantia polymorpha TaxID=3197 RepID=A0A2R6WJS3_MARPO|nr:hypothetical protein MARPO_0083s0070 [Marchantia polymorpha]BBN19657.1 hypothetical protein Mp_8g12500 [Marchantia polymorpha subsp. ruderalis]|eukprot:PTQ34110.1 hypothetical protein MARPO_0083s0070 [Marchantia polymorpha]